MCPRSASPASERDPSAWQDEADLVGRLAAGDGAASRVVVDRYLGPLTRFAYRMLGDAAEAEDVAQEAFERFWRQARRWQPRAKLGTWLFRVGHNLCVDRLRARRVRAEAPVDEPAEPALGTVAKLEREERSRAVVGALGELPERQRAALVLVYYEGLGNQEAAQVMEINVEALESLLARARRQLRKRLSPALAIDGMAAPTEGS